jgi:serpin B
MRIAAIVLLLVAFSPLAASGEAPAPPPQGDPRPTARALTAFSFDLHAAVRKSGGNTFFSPYSVFTALAMAQQGAVGETAEELQKVLRAPRGVIAEGMPALAHALRPAMIDNGRNWLGQQQRIPAYRLLVANRMWAHAGAAYEPAFVQGLRSAFGADLRTVDFRRVEETRAAINHWIDEATQRHIRDLVPPGMPAPDTRLVLTNAVYFLGRWKEVFSEGNTKPKPFTTEDGREVRPPTMHQTEWFRFAEMETARLLELPYRGGTLAMVIVLPRAKGGLAAVEQALDGATFRSWLEYLNHREIQLALPRFELTRTADLVEPLEAMGLRRALKLGDADFTGITKAFPLAIGAVLHKAWLRVDEEGTEAAAATALLAPGSAAGMPAPPTPFIVDHPFLFAITHRETGAVLFLGRVADPTAE